MDTTTVDAVTEEESLLREAIVFGRYLIGRPPSAILAARYAEAERMVGAFQAGPLDRRLLTLAVERPWSLAALDAGCAILRPQSPLRDKLSRLAGILEASPDCAHDFLPESRGLSATLICLFWTGLAAIAQLAVGAALLKALEFRVRAAERGQ